MIERRKELNTEKEKLEKRLSTINDVYKSKVAVLDQEGGLQSLKTTFSNYQEENKRLDRITYLYTEYETEIEDILELKRERDKKLHEFRTEIASLKAPSDEGSPNNSPVSTFEDTILEIYKKIYGTSNASFEIEVSELKKTTDRNFVKFVFEVADTGSARSEKEKNIIFDLALLFNEGTSKKHLGILLHDSPFEGVNESTKVEILNWLYDKSEANNNFQYIATINRDSFESLEEHDSLKFNLSDFRIATFTKEKRLLKQEFRPEN